MKKVISPKTNQTILQELSNKNSSLSIKNQKETKSVVEEIKVKSSIILKENESLNNQISDKKIEKQVFYIKCPGKDDREVAYDDVKMMTVLQLKNEIFPDEISKDKNIRLIQQGKMLVDVEKISEIRLPPNSFIHAFISDKVERINSQENNNTAPIDIG